VRPHHVFIDTVEAMSTAARRLLAQGIRVTVSVKAPDKDAAAAIAASLTEVGINTELERAGLPPATVLEAAAVEEGGDEAEATLGMGGPWGVVGLTVAVTLVFTAGVRHMMRNLPEHPFEEESAQFALGQDFFDCVLDWVSWGGTAAGGDFDFSNDKDGVIKYFVSLLSILGVFFFFVDLYCYISNEQRLRKDILILKLGIEDFAQAIIYGVVIASNAGSWGPLVGIIQCLGFSGLKLLEIFKMIQGTGTNNQAATATLGATGPGVPQRPPQAQGSAVYPMGPYAMGQAPNPYAMGQAGQPTASMP
jgi:hypothetical protein